MLQPCGTFRDGYSGAGQARRAIVSHGEALNSAPAQSAAVETFRQPRPFAHRFGLHEHRTSLNSKRRQNVSGATAAPQPSFQDHRAPRTAHRAALLRHLFRPMLQ